MPMAAVQAMAAKSGLVEQLQQQVQQLTGSTTRLSQEHGAHITKLIASIDQLQQTCSSQVMAAAGLCSLLTNVSAWQCVQTTLLL